MRQFFLYSIGIQLQICPCLVVYVDDKVIMGNDQDGIINFEQHLFHYFRTKDLGRFKYAQDVLEESRTR